MTNVFYQVILKFSQVVNMNDYFIYLHDIKTEILLGMALVCCFFGFKIFRIISAVMTFFLVSIGIVELLKNTAHMGVITITFAIVGLMAAFLAYQWYKLSAFMISLLIGYSILDNILDNLWITIVGAIIIGVIAIPFSAYVIIMLTAVYGALTLGIIGIPYIGVEQFEYKIGAVALFCLIGLILQCLMNKNLFKPKLKTIRSEA